MRERADQLPPGIERQVRIGIERNDVADLPEPFDVAGEYHEARVLRAAQDAVELVELAAFSLPSHPPPFGLVPLAPSMKEVEALGPVSGVESRDQFGCRLHDVAIGLERLRIGIGKIAQQREPEIFIVIGE